MLKLHSGKGKKKNEGRAKEVARKSVAGGVQRWDEAGEYEIYRVRGRSEGKERGSCVLRVERDLVAKRGETVAKSSAVSTHARAFTYITEQKKKHKGEGENVARVVQ